MRTSTAKVRVFDAATRAEIQRKKLAALEADNWVEDRPKDDDDDDYQDADSGDGVIANPLDSPADPDAQRKRCARGRDGRGRSEAEEPEEESQERQVQRRAEVQDITGMHTQKAVPLPVGGLGSKLSVFARHALQEIIDDAQYDHYPSWVPNFASVAAGPSIYPKRSFCPITGLLGKYKCPMTGEYLATLPAYETHRETRLKGLV